MQQERETLTAYKQWKIADAHSDLPIKLFCEKHHCMVEPPVGNQISPELLEASSVELQVLALWPLYTQEDLFANCKEQLELIRELGYLPWIGGIAPKKRYVYALEGFEGLAGEIKNLIYFYRQGVRIFMLTWNGSNPFAHGVLGEPEGLTALGKKAVLLINQLGGILDVSHLNEQGFDQVMELADHVMASHSNPRALCDHVRNLTDRQIGLLLQRQGFIGINFYPEFLKQKGEREEDVSARDIVDHIQHILELGGENNVGFGADFGTLNKLPIGIGDVTCYDKIVEEMARRGFEAPLIQKICYDNLANFLEEALG